MRAADYDRSETSWALRSGSAATGADDGEGADGDEERSDGAHRRDVLPGSRQAAAAGRRGRGGTRADDGEVGAQLLGLAGGEDRGAAERGVGRDGDGGGEGAVGVGHGRARRAT